MKKYVIANWKMYLDPRQSVQITQSILSFLKNHTDSFSKLIICPSFISLQEIGGIIGLGRSNKIQLGGQDVFWQENGAYTGEISAKMLRNTRCRYVIIGHSERRSLGETDQMIQKKMQAAWKARLIPILCVGESFEAYQKKQSFTVIKRELTSALAFIPKGSKCMIAYEPIWAISSQKQASIDDIYITSQMQQIRTWLEDSYKGDNISFKLIYGGSVDASNINIFLNNPIIDGVLIGSASTRFSSLKQILQKIA